MSQLFITRATISYEDAARQFLNTSYKWHQFIWKAFPTKDGARDFLYRIDSALDGITITILSPEATINPGLSTWQCKPIPDTFFLQPKYRFKLRANPTFKTPNGKRYNLHRQDDILHWLQCKALRCGVKFSPNSEISIAPYNQLSVQGVDISGTLTVTNIDDFKKAVKLGIGKGKAFGFGLLTLAPTI